MNAVVKIMQDDGVESPREWDNCGVMFCEHRRYNLGDVDATDPSDVEDEVAVSLPLYLYDHSGITMRTTPFSCQWDSGQVGIIYMTREVMDREFSGDEAKAYACLEAEVKVYDDFITGNVWHFTVETEDGEHVHSCGGFIGDTLESSGILGNMDQEYHEAAEKAWDERYFCGL